MTNQEIDRRLALAIGYTANRVRCFPSLNPDHDFVQVLNDYSRGDGPMQYQGWQYFDHTDPAVIWPIAERFDAFPEKGQTLKDIWFAGQNLGQEFGKVCAATATALAVIQYCEGGK